MNEIVTYPFVHYVLMLLIPVVFFKLARGVHLGKGSDPVANTYISIIYTCLFCISALVFYRCVNALFHVSTRYLPVVLFLLMEFSLPILVVFSTGLLVRKARRYARGRR